MIIMPKDIGKKIRAGYRQKQKDGIVITPPFGYWKDKNTVQIKVDTEAAVTVQLIYSLYLQGCGQKEIARRLNAAGRKHRRSSGLNGAAEKSGIRTKPVMGSSYGHMPV